MKKDTKDTPIAFRAPSAGVARMLSSALKIMRPPPAEMTVKLPDDLLRADLAERLIKAVILELSRVP